MNCCRLARQHPDLAARYIACAERSENNKAFRVNTAHVEQIEQQLLSAIKHVEQQLQPGPFLLGDNYSLADVIWTVVLARLELLGYDELAKGKDFPLTADYYQRVQQRKSYTLAQVQNTWWDS